MSETPSGGFLWSWYVGTVRRHLPIITVMFCQALFAGLAALLYFVTRVDFAAAFEHHDGRFAFQTHLAMTSWFLPLLVLIAVSCDLVALAMPKRSAKYALLGAGLILPAFGLALAVHGIFVPVFQGTPLP